MHRLIRIRIIRDFEHLEERWRCRLDHLGESHRATSHFRPAADFYETARGLVLRLEVARELVVLLPLVHLLLHLLELGLALRRDGGDAELGYWARLSPFPCIPYSGRPGCWARVRERLHLPASVPAPDCERIMARHPEYREWPEGKLDPEQLVQLAAHVRVRGFQRERAEYLPERPVCAATP